MPKCCNAARHCSWPASLETQPSPHAAVPGVPPPLPAEVLGACRALLPAMHMLALPALHTPACAAGEAQRPPSQAPAYHTACPLAAAPVAAAAAAPRPLPRPPFWDSADRHGYDPFTLELDMKPFGAHQPKISLQVGCCLVWMAWWRIPCCDRFTFDLDMRLHIQL